MCLPRTSPASKDGDSILNPVIDRIGAETRPYCYGRRCDRDRRTDQSRRQRSRRRSLELRPGRDRRRLPDPRGVDSGGSGTAPRNGRLDRCVLSRVRYRFGDDNRSTSRAVSRIPNALAMSIAAVGTATEGGSVGIANRTIEKYSHGPCENIPNSGRIRSGYIPH